MNILIIDDSIDTAQLLKHQLREGNTLTFAENGTEGIHCLCSDKFDIVICDHNMPERLGSDVYSWLRLVDDETLFIHHTSEISSVALYYGWASDNRFLSVDKLRGSADKILEIVEELKLK